MLEFSVTKQNNDVFDDLGPNNYIFHSSYNTFKIIANGAISNLTVNAHPTVFTLVHNLERVPNFYAFCKFPDGKVVLAGPHSIDFTVQPEVSNGYGAFTPEVDDNALYFGFEDSFIGSFPGSYNIDISWYIFESSL